MRKDRLFIIIMALVTANLSYQLITTLLIITGGWWNNIWLWFLAIADVIAIIGVLWLLQNQRRRRRLEKEHNGKDKAQ